MYVKNGFLYALSCTLFFRRRLWDEGVLTCNPSFKAAGDADLVLRLLGAGCICRHIPIYFSLFGVDGKNLTVSMSDRRLHETAQLRKTYGAIPLRIIRRLIMSGRYLERFFRGCYGKENLVYAYTVNEIPEYITKRCSGIGSRFTFERSIGQVAASAKDGIME